VITSLIFSFINISISDCLVVCCMYMMPPIVDDIAIVFCSVVSYCSVRIYFWTAWRFFVLLAFYSSLSSFQCSCFVAVFLLPFSGIQRLYSYRIAYRFFPFTFVIDFQLDLTTLAVSLAENILMFWGLPWKDFSLSF